MGVTMISLQILFVSTVLLCGDGGVVDPSICKEKKCTHGCVVSENPSWIIECINNFLTCKEESSRAVACIWNGVQIGGEFLRKFN
jgi:hypothetical protein